jgi:ribonuclease PH
MSSFERQSRQSGDRWIGRRIYFTALCPNHCDRRNGSTEIVTGVVIAKMRADTKHIAMATIGRADVLVNWNFKHISTCSRQDRGRDRGHDIGRRVEMARLSRCP